MDAERFDTLSRSLVMASSRRRVLQLISGGLAAIVGRTVWDETAARKKGKKKTCRGATKKCGKRCIPKANCCTSSQCSPGQVCHNGGCVDCTSANDCPAPPPCAEAVCQDGRCATVLRPAGFPCEAEPSCVINKTCGGAGQCQGGVPVDVLCPETEFCDPQHGCRCPAGSVACNGQCGLPDLAACTEHAACCSGRCIEEQCWPCLGKPCESDGDCCSGLSCEAGWCGGACLIAAESCGVFPPTCCFSECNDFEFASRCLSFPGQRCTFDFDCWACWELNQCFNACVGGFCACPTECCTDAQCRPAEVCRGGTCQPQGGG